MKSGSLRGLANLLRIIQQAKLKIPVKTRLTECCPIPNFGILRKLLVWFSKPICFSRTLNTSLSFSSSFLGKVCSFRLFCFSWLLVGVILSPTDFEQIIKKCYNKIKRTERKMCNLISQNMFGCNCVSFLYMWFYIFIFYILVCIC